MRLSEQAVVNYVFREAANPSQASSNLPERSPAPAPPRAAPNFTQQVFSPPSEPGPFRHTANASKTLRVYVNTTSPVRCAITARISSPRSSPLSILWVSFPHAWMACSRWLLVRYVFRGPNRVAASHGSRQIQSSWSSTCALNTHCWGESALFTPRGPSLYARHSKSMM